MADSHTGLRLTIDGLNKFRPCSDEAPRVRKTLRKFNPDPDHAFSAAEAREAGCTFGDIVWVAAKVAENDKVVERRLRHWMADCAEHVLHIFEARYLADDRPRKAIEAARLFADGEIDADALDAAWAAAWAAARAVASAVARAAARAAVWAAAGDTLAAWAAAGAGARDAEEQWQFDRLILWLSDPEPEPIPLPAKGDGGQADG